MPIAWPAVRPVLWIAALGVELLLLTGCGPSESNRPRVVEEHWPGGMVRTRRTVIENSQGELVNHGTLESFYEDGTPRSRGRWEMGQKHGEFVYWHANGQKRAELTNRQGRADGTFRAWDDAGNLIREETWRDGRPIDGDRDESAPIEPIAD